MEFSLAGDHIRLQHKDRHSRRDEVERHRDQLLARILWVALHSHPLGVHLEADHVVESDSRRGGHTRSRVEVVTGGDIRHDVGCSHRVEEARDADRSSRRLVVGSLHVHERMEESESGSESRSALEPHLEPDKSKHL